MERFERLIASGAGRGITDFHIISGTPLVFRHNGTIRFDTTSRWSAREVRELLDWLLKPGDKLTLENRLSVDFAVTVRGIRIRVNAFNSTQGLALAARLLPGKIPTITSLNLHPSLVEHCNLPHGLILICGATGSGKSTTIAAMVEQINHTRPARVITLENPVEYRYVPRKCLFSQRELGTHMPSFEQGLVDVLREDPDVVVVGELREPETMRLTLNAAESGHLVIATLHATNSEDALHRICNAFSPEVQGAVRSQLSSTLRLLVVQQLLYLDRIGFRVPLLSILVGSQAVKGVVRDSRFEQIESIMETGFNQGMFTMNQYRTRFLDTRQSFTPPAISFAPSEELAAMQPDGPPAPSAPTRLSVRIDEPDSGTTRAAPPAGGPDSERHHGEEYVIDEGHSLEQLIEELKCKP